MQNIIGKKIVIEYGPYFEKHREHELRRIKRELGVIIVDTLLKKSPVTVSLLDFTYLDMEQDPVMRELPSQRGAQVINIQVRIDHYNCKETDQEKEKK